MNQVWEAQRARVSMEHVDTAAMAKAGETQQKEGYVSEELVPWVGLRLIVSLPGPALPPPACHMRSSYGGQYLPQVLGSLHL